MSARKVNILSDAEIAYYYHLPDFDKNERELYFSLNNVELALANKFETDHTFLFFVLQLGYFKAKLRFFDFNFETVPLKDIQCITEKYGFVD